MGAVLTYYWLTSNSNYIFLTHSWHSNDIQMTNFWHPTEILLTHRSLQVVIEERRGNMGKLGFAWNQINYRNQDHLDPLACNRSSDTWTHKRQWPRCLNRAERRVCWTGDLLSSLLPHRFRRGQLSVCHKQWPRWRMRVLHNPAPTAVLVNASM